MNHRYAEINKDKIKERTRNDRINNCAQLKQRAYEHLICECGRVFMRQTKPRHERTKKHQQYLIKQRDTEGHTEEFLQTFQDT